MATLLAFSTNIAPSGGQLSGWSSMHEKMLHKYVFEAVSEVHDHNELCWSGEVLAEQGCRFAARGPQTVCMSGSAVIQWLQRAYWSPACTTVSSMHKKTWHRYVFQAVPEVHGVIKRGAGLAKC